MKEVVDRELQELQRSDKSSFNKLINCIEFNNIMEIQKNLKTGQDIWRGKVHHWFASFIQVIKI